MASRLELFKAAGVVREYPDLDKITEDAYNSLERKIWEHNLEDSPHGRPWHTSFHSSSFPGSVRPCPRKAIYSMMDIPNAEPVGAYLRSVADIGQAVEYQIVYRWGKAGITIGGSSPIEDGGEMNQLHFIDPSTWLTGAVDAVLDLRPELKSVIPVDIKSKKHNVVLEMQDGTKSYDPKHYMQVQAYIYFCNLYHDDMGWSAMGLEPAKSAYIYYASREDPRTTKAFYIPADWDLINNGITLLKDWRESFIDDELPERPKGWLWTLEPCRYCDFKKYACKPDWKTKTEKISDSKAIEFAIELRPTYNFDKIKEKVIKKWS